MRVQFVSDLHLEFPENRDYLREHPLVPKGEVLVLAGDIVSDKYRKKADPFYARWQSEFELVVSAMGNHEFYHGLVGYSLPSYRKELAPNHLLLNNSVVEHGRVRFLVSTLWSEVPPQKALLVESRMNDFRIIFKREFGEKIPITTDDTNRFHRLSKDFLSAELAKNFAGSTVVVSHFLPSFDCIDSKWRGKEMEPAYASNLNGLIAEHDIAAWIFGHQHESVDMTLGETRLLSNPLGYVDEGRNEVFSRERVVEVQGERGAECF